MAIHEDQDGNLLYPKRGAQPALIPGYRRDPGNPFRLMPEWPPCRLRISQVIVLPCGKKKLTQSCRAEQRCSPLDCQECIMDETQEKLLEKFPPA